MSTLLFSEDGQEFGLPGIGIPPEVFFNNALTNTEKMLFGVIENFSHSPKGCWATNNYLGLYIGKSGDIVSKSVSKLFKLQYITVEYLKKNDNTTVRRIHIDPNYKNVHHEMLKEVFVGIRERRYPSKNNPPIVKNNYTPPLKITNNVLSECTKVVTSKEVIGDVAHPVISQPSFSRKKPAIQIPIPKEKPPQPLIPKRHPLNGLVDIWNNAPGKRPYHDITKPLTLLNNAKRYYDQLVNGTFFRDNKVNLNSKSLNDKIIEWQRESKKFTYSEISEALKNTMLHYLGGYWPENKKGLPQSIDGIFYNPKSEHSRLIASMINPPKQLKDTIVIKEIDPDLTNEILDAAGAERTPANIKKANEFIRLTKTHWDITTDTYNVNGQGRDFYKQHPSWYMFVIRYIEWMQDNAWPSKIDIGCFDAAGGVLRTWYEYLRKEYSDEDCDFKIIKSL